MAAIKHSKKGGYSVLTLLRDLKDGESIIIPVPPHLTRVRFQANLKAVQSKSEGTLIIHTMQVFFFSGTPVKDERLLEAIRCTVRRKKGG